MILVIKRLQELGASCYNDQVTGSAIFCSIPCWEQEVYLVAKESRMCLGATQRPFKCVQGVLS
jgi:hypothetical protein